MFIFFHKEFKQKYVLPPNGYHVHNIVSTLAH